MPSFPVTEAVDMLQGVWRSRDARGARHRVRGTTVTSETTGGEVSLLVAVHGGDTDIELMGVRLLRASSTPMRLAWADGDIWDREPEAPDGAAPQQCAAAVPAVTVLQHRSFSPPLLPEPLAGLRQSPPRSPRCGGAPGAARRSPLPPGEAGAACPALPFCRREPADDAAVFALRLPRREGSPRSPRPDAAPRGAPARGRRWGEESGAPEGRRAAGAAAGVVCAEAHSAGCSGNWRRHAAASVACEWQRADAGAAGGGWRRVARREAELAQGLSAGGAAQLSTQRRGGDAPQGRAGAAARPLRGCGPRDSPQRRSPRMSPRCGGAPRPDAAPQPPPQHISPRPSGRGGGCRGPLRAPLVHCRPRPTDDRYVSPPPLESPARADRGGVSGAVERQSRTESPPLPAERRAASGADPGPSRLARSASRLAG
eukprot:TRINITY_DN40528_c0_g1_i1.p1 TRINITY_DN40528_c0_g1~~TRINITY_DN40528_c0_g1_i1.p1  ORF type:complete len:428 (+),score=54.10 TRINITY_DN40528_c0_g1_i1:90-1373(+)